MAKKAQGISMNVIIIAAIALLVLVILSVIFMGRMGVFSPGVSDCENKGGVCRGACLTEEGERPLTIHQCSKEQQNMGNTVCCMQY